MGRAPFTHLIYPTPEASAAGFGAHATFDLGGQVRFGPDVAWMQALGYQVDESSRGLFADIFLPLMRKGCLLAIVACALNSPYPGQPAADSSLQGPGIHGLPG